MGLKSGINYVDGSWGPWHGCTRVSAGCDHCYAQRDMKRFGIDGGVVKRASRGTFRGPLSKKWKAGMRVFVCPWSDFWHADADAWRPEAWDIIRQRPDLTFVIVSKRIELAADRLPADWGAGWPHVWLGATVENEAQRDPRIPVLLETPAAVRFVSIEPMLGAVDIVPWMGGRAYKCQCEKAWHHTEIRRLLPLGEEAQCRECGTFAKIYPTLDWVIVGGESGPGARPMHPDWVRDVRDQCQETDTPFFFKQWGAWVPPRGMSPWDFSLERGAIGIMAGTSEPVRLVSTSKAHTGELTPRTLEKERVHLASDGTMMVRVEKKAAGRVLDRRTWDALPKQVG